MFDALATGAEKVYHPGNRVLRRMFVRWNVWPVMAEPCAACC